MVHFFGILGPDFGRRIKAPDAPNKAGFFGGFPDFSLGAVPMSRAEQEACSLADEAPEPLDDDRSPEVPLASFNRPV